MTNIPDNWIETPIKSIAKVITGKTPSTNIAENYGKDIPFITPGDLGNSKHVHTTERYITYKGAMGLKILPPKTCVFTCIGSTIGKVGLTVTESTTNQQLNAIIANSNISSEFLYYTLAYIAPKIKIIAGVQAVPIINKTEFENTKIFIPINKTEQRAIADILSTWDAAIEKMEKLIEAKEKRFKGLLKEIIENPNNKEINTKLGAICIVKKGKQLNKVHMENSGKYYALNGGIEPSGRTNNWNTEANTITISEGGNSCGFISYNSERFWSGGHCYALESLNDNIHIDYLYYYLKYFEPKIMRLRVGSGLPNIQKKDINKFQLDFPKLEEQINDALKLKLTNKEIEILKEVVEKYKEQKRGLMQKLLTGEWRVKV